MKSQERRIKKLEGRATPDADLDYSKLTDNELDFIIAALEGDPTPEEQKRLHNLEQKITVL